MYAPLRILLLMVASVLFLSYPHANEQSSSKWRLVWADEFDVEGLPDAKRWGYDVGGHGWGNKELQYYTSARKENARVENGHLIIEARRDAFEGHEYTSARLVSKGKGDWTYGRFEIRAKLPTGRGTWPAIWMLPSHREYGGWPDGGEIDIMEHVGFDPDVVHASVHTKSYHHSIGTQKTANVKVASSRTEFNTYAVEWSPEEVRAFVNDQHYFTFKNERLTNAAADHKQWPFDKPFHLLLNIAVGGTWGGTKGVDQTIWPQRMEVDYVRVYQLKPQKAANKDQTANEQNEAANLQGRERRQQLISYLDGIAQKAVTIDPVEDRIRVLTAVSDAFWFLDTSRAASSYTQLFQMMDNLASEPGVDLNRIKSLRQAALARVARFDRELAAKLVGNDPPPRPVEKRSRDLNAEGTPYPETLTAIALDLLKTDPKQSISLAQLALREGMTQTARIYLLKLRAVDQVAADSLFELALMHATTRNPGRLFDVLAFWDYTFQPGEMHFGPVAWPKSVEARTYEVSEARKFAVLQFAVNALNQNIQLRTSTTDASGSQIQVAQLYSVVQQLLPHINGYIPQAAESLRAELAVLEQVIRGSGQSLPSVRPFGPTPEQTTSAVESLVQKAEQLSAGKERDELYLAAAYRLLIAGHFEKAASMAKRIDDLEMKNAITDAINFNWSSWLTYAGKYTEALNLARTIRADEPRILALTKISGGHTDAIVADELLNESQTLAAKATPSAAVATAVLSIALTRATDQRDTTKAFEALSLAISIINKSTSDTLNWQILNRQTAKMLNTSASLNSVSSPAGGLKSIRVTYPHLAGLSDVFAEASKHDLHQAMRVAQDLNSKALSLALQASICSASALRLMQEGN